jgi:hypothetical protein
MRNPLGIAIFVVSILTSATSNAAPTSFSDSQYTARKSLDTRILLAKGAKSGKTRERRLSSEKEVRSSSGTASTNIDFDAVDIAGERKTPLGSMVSQSKSDMDYDFVKIRMRWHPEMVQSAASLESGSTTK